MTKQEKQIKEEERYAVSLFCGVAVVCGACWGEKIKNGINRSLFL
jgi:hypothetical protein